MTTAEDKENEKLFSQMSTALRTQDWDKLDELATSPEEKKEEETTEVETPAEEETKEPEESTKQEKESEESDTETPAEKQPEETEGDKDKETPAEETEQEKLRKALDLIESVKKENHALRSQAGRVPYLQRRLQELDTKLEKVTTLATSPSSQPSAKINPKITEKLKKIRDADPELADVLAEVMSEATDGVAAELRGAEIEALRSQREAVSKEYIKAETERLTEMYPNAGEVFASPSWTAWKESQTSRIRGLAESDSADDVAFAFEKYAQDMVKKYPELAPKEAASSEKKEEPNGEAEKIEAERRRKKESTAVIGTPPAAGRTAKPDSEEALFKQFSAQIRKELTGK